MTASRHFSDSYATARDKFRAAAGRAGASPETVAHPDTGPKGEALGTDVAWFGPRDAAKVVVLVSATHGVEGFCGSGCQIGWIEAGGYKSLPKDMAALVIHAINPHGFAWVRRVTEDNVDLNRNFADFSKALPHNAAYDAIAHAVAPKDWGEAGCAESARILDDYAKQHGDRALQSAVAGGQYKHADGLFYGGKAPTWSRRTFLDIVGRYLGKACQVALIDFHTGLGPYGYGEPICLSAPDSPAVERAEAWWGSEVTVPARGDSSSAVVVGTLSEGLENALPNAEVTAIGLEYGTQPTPDVMLALRADNWLHLFGKLDSQQGQAIKRQIRDAFYQDKDDWKDMVLQRALHILDGAIKGLSKGPVKE